MQLANLISIVSTVCSIQVGAFILALHYAVARRTANLIFGLLCIVLGATAFCSFMSSVESELYDVLVWVRLEHALHFLTAGMFAHFIALYLGQSLSPSFTRLMYAVCIVFSVLTFTPAFLSLPESGQLQGSPISFRLGPLYASMLWGFMLWLTPVWFLLRRWRTIVSGSGEVIGSTGELNVLSETLPIDAEAKLMGELRLMLIGAIAVVALCWLDFGAAALGAIKPLRLHPLGILLLSLLGAIPVGRRAIFSELQSRELATLLRAREAAADDVAHEMKTPLTVIKGYALTLLRMPSTEIDEGFLRESLTAIADEAERLTRMINNMLDIARLEAGKPVTLRPQNINLKIMLSQLLERMQRLTDKHELKLQWLANDEEFEIDADKVYQVVMNLLDNAIKYSPNGGEVIVKVEDANKHLRISVIDQGIGMSQEQLARLFRRFERFVEPKRRITGTGIGLYLMRQLVEAMGGEMGVQSELGKGSTFWFTVPKEIRT
ncbi:MAG: ATP-binding protein [Armatimonadota bacterium]|nr:ATP-binding protein [Armatimonadota bacterium]MCX7776595.1 ATP-binding protein [Armatimonadota bacterium]MDW8025262.1 ATP-binding protein [Armatimonadota bacterium]